MRVMAYLGALMALVALTGAWLYRTGRLERSRWYLWTAVVATAFPFGAALAGWVLTDPDDGHEIFPRTDPAIIVGVTDDQDRLLLGSNALWEKNRYSLLAGFVEPGESLEQAVQREIFEESGVRVIDPVGPRAPSWTRGRLRVKGRGPRDTYG